MSQMTSGATGSLDLFFQLEDPLFQQANIPPRTRRPHRKEQKAKCSSARRFVFFATLLSKQTRCFSFFTRFLFLLSSPHRFSLNSLFFFSLFFSPSEGKKLKFFSTRITTDKRKNHQKCSADNCRCLIKMRGLL